MKSKHKIIILILLTTLVITCTSAPAVDYSSLGAGTDKIPLTNRALTGNLPNGLRYYIMENSLPENRVYIALVVKAGSVLERDDERGYAHFIEHLAFLDTERFPNNEILNYLRSLGSRFGANVNAYTSYDETVYYFDIPVENVNGIKRIPSRALEILDDWTHAVTFKPEVVDSERRVVLEEIRARSGAMERVRKITLPIIFAGSIYAERDVIGLAETIENAASEQLKNFYDRYYKSDNMAFIFIGDFDGKLLESELAGHFNIPAPIQPVNRRFNDLPPPKKGNFQVEIITDPELTSTSFNIYYKQRLGAQRGTISYYRESIIDYLINFMLSRRFDEKAEDPEAAAVESWGGIWRWSANSRFYSMGTQPKTMLDERALFELLMEKESMRRYGFTEGELQRAKLNLVSYMERLVSERDRTESRTFVRGFTNHFLYGEDMADIEWELNAVNLLLPGISLGEISMAAQNYFSADDCIIFLIAPQAEAENLLTKEQIKYIYNLTKSLSVEQRLDIVLSGGLMENVPSPGMIVSEERDAETGAYILVLSNGARVILQETANRNNEIIIYAAANGGTYNAPEDSIVSVNLLSEMLNASGIGPYSRTELVNKLSGKQAAVSYWKHGTARGFQGSSTTQDITALFELVHLFFTEPRLDKRVITSMLDQLKTALIHQNENPQRVFQREIGRVLTGDNPYLKTLELEDIDKITIEQAENFLKQCLNPGDYTFIFTGNLDINLMRELSAYYIASIPNAVSMNQWVDPGIVRPAPGRKIINRGVDDRSIVYLAWFNPGSFEFDEQKSQITSVLSEYLNIILSDEIRENLGGVYSISARAGILVIPASELFLEVSFICSPQRAEELIEAVINNINNIINKPVNIDTLNKAKEALIMSHERSIQLNLHIAQSYANSFVFYDTPLNRLHLRPDIIRNVSAEDIKSLCREIINSGSVEFIMFPE